MDLFYEEALLLLEISLVGSFVKSLLNFYKHISSELIFLKVRYSDDHHNYHNRGPGLGKQLLPRFLEQWSLGDFQILIHFYSSHNIFDSFYSNLAQVFYSAFCNSLNQFVGQGQIIFPKNTLRENAQVHHVRINLYTHLKPT